MRVQIGLSLGSNLGDKVSHLRRAAQLILDQKDAVLVGKSSLYETEPVDVKAEFQHMKFLNSVMVIETGLDAQHWLKTIGEVEYALGRRRDTDDRNVPRQVDVDIIFYGDQLIGSGGLVVPHPRWAERRFVVQPLAELQPDRVLPGMTETVAEVLKDLPGAGDLIQLDTEW
ncbi:2-amino-4-hydroxy-6-hydroxymethyldihydropteridine diphosphokinase [Kiritimatiellota bacterium B12222]|nr:2-amino-4-hydroxy-6-hydroxymethyldihydropteridine diphosphokinase [Kiritimatiellota bacterium B12222]